MRLREATFVTSVVAVRQCPAAVAEVAFYGRSNVGKSSLLAAVLEARAQVRISRRPGRTRHLNYFGWVGMDNPCYLVDAPGYGYAAVSKREAAAMGRLVQHYLRTRRALVGVVLLCDIRRELGDEERWVLETVAQRRIACQLALCKADKVSFSAARQRQAKMQSELGDSASVVLCSSLKGVGTEALREWVVARLRGGG